jgi:ABC-type lipoprotein release transport system permease subunit
MKTSIITKFAVRSLGRSYRRTLLSVIGVGVGCAVALFLTSFMRGSSDIRLRAIADSGVGHLRITPSEWPVSRENDLRLVDWQKELATVRSLEVVKEAAPRARKTALLAFGTRVVGVELTGVDPEIEPKLNRLIRTVKEGRYLLPAETGATVVGNTITERLDVELDDDLLLTAVGEDGEMQYAMLRIVGIVDTGSRDLDASICHVNLLDVERLTGLEGAGEVTVVLHDAGLIDETALRLREVIPEGDVVLTWKEIVPAMGADASSDKAFMDMIIGIVIVVVVLGITSAQMTAVLRRKREFAVLIALGMKSYQVIRLLSLEAVTIGVLGGVAGLILSFPVVYYFSTTGIDFSKLMGGDTSVSGVLFDPVFYSDMGPWMIPYALLIALAAVFVATIYPAWIAIRTNPTSALSLREA